MAEAFKGTVSLIAGIGQANGQKFALMDGAAVQYKTEDKDGAPFKSVTDKIEEIEEISTPVTSEEIQTIMSTVFGE